MLSFNDPQVAPALPQATPQSAPIPRPLTPCLAITPWQTTTRELRKKVHFVSMYGKVGVWLHINQLPKACEKSFTLFQYSEMTGQNFIKNHYIIDVSYIKDIPKPK
jgi:hypothetical protein